MDPILGEGCWPRVAGDESAAPASWLAALETFRVKLELKRQDFIEKFEGEAYEDIAEENHASIKAAA